MSTKRGNVVGGGDDRRSGDVDKSFADAIDITGAILTKLDGDTRGGAALSVREVSGKPIKFTGVGEKMGVRPILSRKKQAES